VKIGRRAGVSQSFPRREKDDGKLSSRGKTECRGGEGKINGHALIFPDRLRETIQEGSVHQIHGLDGMHDGGIRS